MLLSRAFFVSLDWVTLVQQTVDEDPVVIISKQSAWTVGVAFWHDMRSVNSALPQRRLQRPSGHSLLDWARYVVADDNCARTITRSRQHPASVRNSHALCLASVVAH